MTTQITGALNLAQPNKVFHISVNAEGLLRIDVYKDDVLIDTKDGLPSPLVIVRGSAILEFPLGDDGNGGGGERVAFLNFEHWPVGQEYGTAEYKADGLEVGFSSWRNASITDSPSLGSRSLRIRYQSGTFGGGSGPNVETILPPKDEYYLSYWIQFADNFDWGGRHEGGKLPGLAGKGLASGGQEVTGSNGFTARYMWRPDGRAVIYLYHMDKPGKWGEDLQLKDASGLDKFFKRGQWHKLTQRIKINTGNNNDGHVQVWMDGEEVLLRTDIRFVNNGAKVDRFYFNTFHGGGDSDWAPSVTSYAYFDDIDIWSE